MALRLLATLAAALLLPFCVAAQPNVILIVADDMGFGDVGYNGAEIATPHLDRLADEGIVLDRFYSSPLCSPSRAGLLTGRYGLRMGIAEPVTMADTVGLPQAETTLAEALQGAGYETAMVGKWHLGDDCHQHPRAHGFDSFLGAVSGGAQYWTRRTSQGLDWWRDYTPEVTEGYTTELIAAEAVDILSRPRDGPLFLYLPFTAPHTPLQAPEADLALYDHLPEPRRTYAAMVTNLDRGIGQIMDAVRASGAPTLVWFLSDNGAVEAFGGDNGPLRGGKGQTWEGAIRVPSVVWYPAWGTRRIGHPVWYLDVLPTVLALAPGATPPALPLDGIDQGAFLRGAAPTGDVLNRRLYSFRRVSDGGYWRGAQADRWKYHEQFAGGVTRRYVFALDRDPSEERNRLRREPRVVREFGAEAAAFAALTPPWASSDTTLSAVNVPDLAECAANPARITTLIGGPEGARYLGPPAEGVTVDDLAGQNLVQGVPGYFPEATPVTLFTAYDAATAGWAPSTGAGEELRLGHAFRWQMVDGEMGDPMVSVSVPRPFTLGTGRPANVTDVRVALDTDGSRMNLLANPFGVPLDLGTLATWDGADNLSPTSPVWTYDPVARTWEEASGVIGPWEAFRVRAKGPRASGTLRTLRIPFSATSSPSASRTAPMPGLRFTLSGVDVEGVPVADRGFAIRFEEGARDGFDAEEDVEKLQVPAEAYALIGTRVDGAFVGTDVRPFADAEISLAIEARGTAARGTLAWDASALPQGLPVVLVDLVTGIETDVRTRSSITLDLSTQTAHEEVPLHDLADGAEATDRFVLRIGTPRVLAAGAVPEVALEPVAPNPSSGSARVAFALPEAGSIRLTVVDVRGREVAVLADGPRAAGRHETRLGSALAAGVYVVRLEAGGAVVTRQAVVVR